MHASLVGTLPYLVFAACMHACLVWGFGEGPALETVNRLRRHFVETCTKQNVYAAKGIEKKRDSTA